LGVGGGEGFTFFRTVRHRKRLCAPRGGVRGLSCGILPRPPSCGCNTPPSPPHRSLPESTRGGTLSIGMPLKDGRKKVRLLEMKKAGGWTNRVGNKTLPQTSTTTTIKCSGTQGGPVAGHRLLSWTPTSALPFPLLPRRASNQGTPRRVRGEGSLTKINATVKHPFVLASFSWGMPLAPPFFF